MKRRFLSLIFSITLSGILTAQSMVMPVPLYVDSLYLGEVDVKIEGETILIQPVPLIQRLDDRLDEEQKNAALNRWDDEEWVMPESLSTTVIRPEFDEENLLLTVDIPPEFRKTNVYSLISVPPVPDGNIAMAAPFSALLNFDGWGRMFYEEQKFDYRLGPELAAQYEGYALEARGGIKSGNELFFYDYLRGVKDFPSLMSRAEAGSLTYTAGGFHSAGMTGLSFFRKTDLDYTYISRPALGQTIFFAEAADVEVSINGRISRRLRVQPGTWTIQHFPLVQGANNVAIKWTDSQGDHEESFFLVYHGQLLGKGEYDYGSSLGTDSYTTFNPAMLLHMANGVMTNLTMGMDLYYDINSSHYALGAPLLTATVLGTFQLSPRLDLYMAGGYGLDFQLSHSYSEKNRKGKGVNFGSVIGYSRTTYPGTGQAVNASGYWSITPTQGLNFTPSLGWVWNLERTVHDLSMKLRVRKSSGDGSIISTDVGLKYNEYGWTPMASITFSASLHEIQQSFYARGDLSGKKMNVSWSRYPSSEKASDYSLGASGIIPADNTERLSLTMNGGYSHPLFTIAGNQGFNAVFSQEEYVNTSTLTFGSALVFADGVLGFSQPVRGSFVMVNSEIGPIEVNPRKNSSLLSIGPDRPGVLSTVSPYRYTTLFLVPEALPIGSDINDYTFTVFPTYRSGTLINVEEKVFMYAGGILLDENGEPAALMAGYLSSGQEIFTDEAGYFECYSLEPGPYEITLDGDKMVYNVIIEKNDSGFCLLGEVYPEE